MDGVGSQFAALYVLYHDDIWLPYSYASIYESVGAIYFFVARGPWQGPPEDNSSTLKLLEALPDPGRKKRILRGDWKSEAEQRNFSLAQATVDGFRYGVIIDADEVYDAAVFNQMCNFAARRPEVDVWHMRWITYWKNAGFRIHPIESYQPPLFAKLGSCGCVEARNLLGSRHELVPPEVGLCHHFSYARSNELILRKISSFSHAHQLVPNWYHDVWLAWDHDNALKNLHPVTPELYQQAVVQPREMLPAVVRGEPSL